MLPLSLLAQFLLHSHTEDISILTGQENLTNTHHLILLLLLFLLLLLPFRFDGFPGSSEALLITSGFSFVLGLHLQKLTFRLEGVGLQQLVDLRHFTRQSGSRLL